MTVSRRRLQRAGNLAGTSELGRRRRVITLGKSQRDAGPEGHGHQRAQQEHETLPGDLTPLVPLVPFHPKAHGVAHHRRPRRIYLASRFSRRTSFKLLAHVRSPTAPQRVDGAGYQGCSIIRWSPISANTITS